MLMNYLNPYNTVFYKYYEQYLMVHYGYTKLNFYLSKYKSKGGNPCYNYLIRNGPGGIRTHDQRIMSHIYYKNLKKS